jgi:hypothetical protein
LRRWDVDTIGCAIVTYVFFIASVITDDDIYIVRLGMARVELTQIDKAISLWSISTATANTSKRRTFTIVTRPTSVVGGTGGEGGAGGDITRTGISGIGAFSSYDLIRISNHHPTGR